MSICNAVRDVAEALEPMAHEPHHSQLIDILKHMPLYRDSNRFTEWEATFTSNFQSSDNSEFNQLLWEVFEFATFNFYGSIDAFQTWQEFQRLRELMRAIGVIVSPPTNFAEW